MAIMVKELSFVGHQLENWGKPAEDLKETSLQVVGNLSLEIPGEGFE